MDAIASLLALFAILMTDTAWHKCDFGTMKLRNVVVRGFVSFSSVAIGLVFVLNALLWFEILPVPEKCNSVEGCITAAEITKAWWNFSERDPGRHYVLAIDRMCDLGRKTACHYLIWFLLKERKSNLFSSENKERDQRATVRLTKTIDDLFKLIDDGDKKNVEGGQLQKQSIPISRRTEDLRLLEFLAYTANDPISQVNLAAKIFSRPNPQGKDQDWRTAEKLLLKAVTQDFTPAYERLGNLYADHRLPLANVEWALLYWRMGCRAGSVESCESLARVFRTGLQKVEPNLGTSKYWSSLAADLKEDRENANTQ